MLMAPASKQKLGKVWIVFGVVTVLMVGGTITLLAVFELLPPQYVAGPGATGSEVFGIDFFKPLHWTATLICLFSFNILSSMLQRKFVIWQWGTIMGDGSKLDVETWALMTINEILNATLGFATLFFSAINIYFLLGCALGRTVGVMIVAQINRRVYHAAIGS